jgi:hypothetical protein
MWVRANMWLKAQLNFHHLHLCSFQYKTPPCKVRLQITTFHSVLCLFHPQQFLDLILLSSWCHWCRGEHLRLHFPTGLGPSSPILSCFSLLVVAQTPMYGSQNLISMAKHPTGHPSGFGQCSSDHVLFLLGLHSRSAAASAQCAVSLLPF